MESPLCNRQSKAAVALRDGDEEVTKRKVRVCRFEATQGDRPPPTAGCLPASSTYWLVGQRIVKHEQSGADRAPYGRTLSKRLAKDLSGKLGRGFSERNLEQMRAFYLTWPNPQMPSAESPLAPISQTLSAKSGVSPGD
jgi:hypothetical protein